MIHWLYNSSEIKSKEDFPPEIFGFIYRITNCTNGKQYIGKKQILSKVNKKLGKKEIAALPVQRGRTPTKKLVITESDWQNYWGSCKPLLNDVKTLGKDKFIREILMFCSSSKQLTYYEMMFQVKEDVLFKDNYNDNILAKFHKRDFPS
jgi:hypothetical protein